MKCSICGEEIEKKINPETGEMYWDQGHNAEPVIENGRCCDACNAEVVIPVRMGSPRDMTVEIRRLKVSGEHPKYIDQNVRGTRQ